MKRLFFLAIAIVAVCGVALPFHIEAPALWWFEGGAIFLLTTLIILYVRTIKPIIAIRNGVALLNEQDFSCRLTHVGQRDADSIAATFNRMVDTLRNERVRVIEQNHFLEMLIDASPAGIIILNFNGTIRSANRAACSMLGDNQLTEKRPEELEGDFANLLSRLCTGQSVTARFSDTQIYRCSRHSFIDSGFQRPFFMIESLTKEVMKAERAAYGKIIRLIGHEVNNTVAGIIPMFETVEMVSDDPDLRDASASCRERCASLSKFITRYDDVVKLPPPTLQLTDISELIRQLMPFLESMTAGRSISIRLDAEPGAVANIDPVQMEQVIVNIVKNSIESIGCDGAIEISTSASPAGFVITDNGRGICSEVAENMFTPFFSTKEGGQGVGLTLVSEILHAHNFSFRLHTSPVDKLTRFTAMVKKS